LSDSKRRWMEHYVDVIQMGVLKFFTGVIAQPIRAFHLQVGHATVTAALIVGFFAAMIGLSWTYMIYSINLPREQARVAEIEENTRRMALANAEKEQSVTLVPVRPWRYMAVTATPTGVDLELPVHLLADQLVVMWKAMSNDPAVVGGSKSGIITVDLTGQTGVSAITLEGIDFSPAWLPGTKIILEASQMLSDGREQRFAGSNRLVIVP